MGHKINIGCGRAPTEDYINLDNSLSIKIANFPFAYNFLKFLFKYNVLKPLKVDQIKNIEWNKKNKIKFVDASLKLPFEDNSVEILYSSHMLEHLSRDDVLKFFNEVRRILMRDGVLRIAVPDLKININGYLEFEDANKFMSNLYVKAPPFRNFREKIELLITGYRHHQWMYDGKSLSSLMKSVGFKNVVILKPGETMIKNPGKLNLFERSSDSLYAEAKKY
tara:strand:+ start:33642 stop:34307 length:666 start_codon:yes stop_codon:yes gene_type:complete